MKGWLKKLTRNWTFPLGRMLSVVVFAIAAQAFLGHLEGKTIWYDWNRSGFGMGLNTSICLMLLSVAVFYLAIEKANRNDLA
jgi:hypothetical protein